MEREVDVVDSKHYSKQYSIQYSMRMPYTM